MSDQAASQPTSQPETTLIEGVTLADAAELLGISVEAVRSRTKRGTLPRYTGSDGKVYVPLSAVQATVAGTPGPQASPQPTIQPIHVASNQPDPETALVAARGQLEAIRDEWLQPLVSQISEQAETIGHLRATVEARDAELARVQRELAQAREEVIAAQQTNQPTGQVSWWKRLFGG